MKKVFIIIMLLAITILAVGCGDKGTIENPKKPYFTVVFDEKQNKEVLSDYLSENDPDVLRATQVISDFYSKMGNRSYKTIIGDETYGYYAKATLDNLIKLNDQKETVSYFKTNKLTHSLKQISFEKLYFNKEKTACIAIVDLKVEVKSDDVNYLKKNSLKQGSLIDTKMQIKLILEKDSLKVDSYKSINTNSK